MEAYLKSVLFLKALSKPNKAVQPNPLQFESKKGKMRVDVYQPQRASKGVLLFVHGMTPKGYRDERMMALGRAAVELNYTGIVPSYPEITNGLIDSRSIENVIETIKVIVADKTLCPQAKLSIFTASFSGCICIRAVAHDSVRDYVNSLLILGGCNNPINSFYEIIHNPGADKYAKLLLLKNLAKHDLQKDEVLTRALSCAIEDAHADFNGAGVYQNFLTHLAEPDRTRVINFIEPVLNNTHNPLIEYDAVQQEIHRSIMAWANVKNIRCRVTLMHSATDNVVMPQESEDLYKELQANSIESRLLISPILEHAGVKFKPSFLIAAVKLLAGLAYFFAGVDR